MSPPNGHYLLLFLTICLMTSGGHFLSPTSNHHYHSNHQYQQQHQEEYHFLPTRSVLIPAVSRLKLPSNQHAIIRRDSPSQQQYSPSVKTHPTTPTVTLIKKIDMSQIEDELKALKKKKKRLRQLRGEIRELSDYLKSKQVFSKDDASENDLRKNHKMKETYARWRKQITSRVKSIMRRLKRLENEVKTERNFTKVRRKLAKRLPMLALNFHTVPSTPHTLLITTSKNFKIKRLHSFINQSKNGEFGAICLGHNDCKPGLCCHRTLSMNANSTISSTANSCYQYMLKEGELCEDSCQCEARLHCFRSSNQLNTDKSIAKSKSNVYAICKKLSSSDIVNGIYLNAKDSSFLIKPPIRQ